MTKLEYPYKLASLYTANDDLSKRWRVTFYVWDTRIHQLVRKQKWIGANFQTKNQRIKEANRLIRSINKLLEDGYHLSANPAKKTGSNNSTLISWLDAWKWAALQKKADVRPRAAQLIDFLVDRLDEYLIKANLSSLPLQYVTRDHVEGLLALLYTRDLSNSTKNLYIKFVKLLFNQLVQSEKITQSPAKSFTLLSVNEVHQQGFQAEIKEKFLNQYKTDCPELLPIVQYIYYSFIRPGELLKLQVKHILPKTIFIPGHISKNKKSEHVLISPALNNFLEKNKIRSFPEHYYLIGFDGLPGTKKPCTHYFSNRHLAVRRALGLGEEYTLYCWKHTGVTDTYRQTLDIEFVSRQCRHSSLDMTKRYLRGLGLLQEYPQRDQLPDLGL